MPIKRKRRALTNAEHALENWGKLQHFSRKPFRPGAFRLSVAKAMKAANHALRASSAA
ncbi:hypothetical protein BRPE64_ACDS19690 [Caballeronia insecticola]|uniref:Uncharacterized protein n=1 Tax=Caballeronia insecticola TaxID=758793 RepID=R4WHN7_9BURK|nr:hypothetical protein BRPE64_ACDS19690 [Caballeronia insecticola]